MTKRILMVVTSHDTLGESGAPTGIWLEELAASYYVFADAGADITIAAPRAGIAPLDPASLEVPWLTESGQRFLKDAAAMARLAGCSSLAALRPLDFDAAYLVGGAGTAWDFPGDAALAAVVEGLWRAGRPVSGVCHGVLGLTAACDKDDRSIIAGRAVTGISNAEEAMTGYDKLVPVLPESRLRDLGGRYSCAAPLAAHVVRDGLLLTGQNPASAGPLAQAVVDALARP